MKNKLLIIPGYLAGLGSLLIVTYQTLLAFFSNSKSVTVYINRFGEQFADILFLILIWIVSLVGLFLLIKITKEDSSLKTKVDNKKHVVDKNGLYLGILHNSMVDEKTGIINKLYVKPSSEIDTTIYQTNEHGHIVVSFDDVNVIKEYIEN